MIVVIADDLSGAAELAGVALQHGLSAEVQTVFQPRTDVAVICLDTDSRLLPAVVAAEINAAVTREVASARPEWIFKKCDSVLRGHVLAEARAVAGVAGRNRIILVSANPTRSRVIREGIYLIDGRPLPETEFGGDPIHPCTSSRVTQLLAGDLTGVETPDIETALDIARIAAACGADDLPVGAADFFTALLELRAPRRPPIPELAAPTGPSLLVCGSAAAWSRRQAEAKDWHLALFPQPHEADRISRTISLEGRAIMGIGDGASGPDRTPAGLTAQLAEMVAIVVRRTKITRLLLEGGATAAGVWAALGWTRMQVLGVHDSVAMLRPAGSTGPMVYIKPGSYPWPPRLWPVDWIE
jgi:uncharacterized protein YgbK (DUF1537 family)